MSRTSDFRVVHRGSITTVICPAEIDFSSVAEIDSALEAAMRNAPGNVIVSMAKVRYFDSTTVHHLMKWVKRAESERRRLAFVRPTSPTGRRLFDVLKLDVMWDVFDSIHHAGNAVSGKER